MILSDGWWFIQGTHNEIVEVEIWVKNIIDMAYRSTVLW